MNNYEKAKKILNKYNQKHIIKFLENSSENIKAKIVNQVLNIDFEEMKDLYNKTFEELYVDLEELEPVKSVNPEDLSKSEIEELKNIGEKIIKENKFAVATMAGGQGTRLRSFKSKRDI